MIKIIKLVTGEEIVADVIENSVMQWKIRKPFHMIPTETGISFMPWFSVSEQDTFDVYSSSVVVSVNASEGLANHWRNNLAGEPEKILTPKKPKIQLTTTSKLN